MKDKPLQRVDHMMWDAEAPNSPVTIAGLMTFSKNISTEKVLDTVVNGLLHYERFKKKVVVKEKGPHWRLDESFQAHTHIHRIALPGKGGAKELQVCVSDLVSQPFNYNKPLWEVHIIENYNGGTALLWRLHHAIADGMALIKVVFSLTGATAKESLAITNGTAIKEDHHGVKHELDEAMELLRKFYDEAQEAMKHPELVGAAFKNSIATMKEVAGIFLGKTVAKSIYKGKLGYAKTVAWSEPFPLADVKKIGKANGCTVNDVLLTAATGALRKHLLKHKEKPTQGLRIVVPINMRKQGSVTKLHNEFGWLSVELPVHMPKQKDRLKFIREKTVMLKPSIEPFFLNEVVHVLADYSPLKVKQWFLDFLGTKIAGVVTNVPGPKQPVYLAGQKVEDLMFWVPHTTALGIGLSLMSYNGKVYMGLVTDSQLVPDPDVVTKAFGQEIKAMSKLC